MVTFNPVMSSAVQRPMTQKSTRSDNISQKSRNNVGFGDMMDSIKYGPSVNDIIKAAEEKNFKKVEALVNQSEESTHFGAIHSDAEKIVIALVENGDSIHWFNLAKKILKNPKRF